MILNRPHAYGVAGLSHSFMRMEKDKENERHSVFWFEGGPVWSTTFSTMKGNSGYLEEKFSDVSVERSGFHCLLDIHIPRLHPQDSDCLGLGCCLGACIFK